MTKKLIIEMRVNEYATRGRNRHVPWTPEELSHTADECREAGASIFHFHPRTPDGGVDFTYETYRDTVTRIRAGSDILIHPTLGAFERAASAVERLANVVRLCADGLRPDFVPIDMGTTNVDSFDQLANRFTSEDRVYTNTTATLRYFAETLRANGVKPYLVIWNITMMRWAGAFHRIGVVNTPLFLGVSLSENSAISLHPGTLKGLYAHLDFLPEGVPSEWTVTLHGASMLHLVDTIIRMGGHISIGLGDHDYRELGEPTNAELTRHIAKLARGAGREIATPAEARTMLGMA